MGVSTPEEILEFISVCQLIIFHVQIPNSYQSGQEYNLIKLARAGPMIKYISL